MDDGLTWDSRTVLHSLSGRVSLVVIMIPVIQHVITVIRCRNHCNRVGQSL